MVVIWYWEVWNSKLLERQIGKLYSQWHSSYPSQAAWLTSTTSAHGVWGFLVHPRGKIPGASFTGPRGPGGGFHTEDRTNKYITSANYLTENLQWMQIRQVLASFQHHIFMSSFYQKEIITGNIYHFIIIPVRLSSNLCNTLQNKTKTRNS